MHSLGLPGLPAASLDGSDGPRCTKKGRSVGHLDVRSREGEEARGRSEGRDSGRGRGRGRDRERHGAMALRETAASKIRLVSLHDRATEEKQQRVAELAGCVVKP